MSASSELFLATHRQASDYARGKGAAPEHRAELGEVSDLDLEILGTLAAQTVHAQGVETELGLVDIDLDNLLVVPDAVTEIWAELGVLEDPEDFTELAARWAATEELDTTTELAEGWLRQISRLASQVIAADESARVALYFVQ
ncbi:hypothetical protein [Psychromicrobium xiongbiense]|uniref:hypothetical protein n=1 Tax=Psychromicrobium xiongbiense TaxID=3051184 RepID=UPI002553C7BA|nr:hypothetical protein [Psychromicrobium sp. YIM S02556]